VHRRGGAPRPLAAVELREVVEELVDEDGDFRAALAQRRHVDVRHRHAPSFDRGF